jgi:hypothetical protein
LPAVFLELRRQRKVNPQNARVLAKAKVLRMDNIQKLVLGCVGTVAILAMLIPEGDPLAKQAAAPTPASAPVPASDAAAQAAAQAGESTANQGLTIQDHDISSFGKPMVDPTPPGQTNEQTNAPQSNDTGDNGDSNYGFAAPANSLSDPSANSVPTMPKSPAPPPPPKPVSLSDQKSPRD